MRTYPDYVIRNRDTSPMALSLCRRIGIKTSEEFWDAYIAPALARREKREREKKEREKKERDANELQDGHC